MTPFILFLYPSRGRKDRFFDGLNSVVNNLYAPEHCHIHCALDGDDEVMNRVDVMERMHAYDNLSYYYGRSKSKIHAINRDLDLFKNGKWDVVVLMSDDMRWQFYGFDEIIRQQFADGDFDKYVHIPDQDAKHALSVVYIAGRTFVERFGYLYNPEYQSLFCDNEIHECAQLLGKYHYVDTPGLILHLNPAYGHLPKDELFIRQQEIGWTIDQQTYNRRKAINFGL